MVEEFVIPDKVVISKDISNNIQSFIFRFVDEIKILGTEKAYNKNRLKVSDYTVKVIAIYHLHYNNKFVSNLTQTSIYIAGCFCFGYSLGYLGNFSTTSLFTYDSRACIA